MEREGGREGGFWLTWKVWKLGVGSWEEAEV